MKVKKIELLEKYDYDIETIPVMHCFLYWNTLKNEKNLTVLKRAIPLPEREVKNNISDKGSCSSGNANLPKREPTYIP
jgi:hypothetical protein